MTVKVVALAMGKVTVKVVRIGMAYIAAHVVSGVRLRQTYFEPCYTKSARPDSVSVLSFLFMAERTSSHTQHQNNM